MIALKSFRLPVVALLLVPGCAGPLALRHSRQKYNEAVQKTAAEQMLLNLVRLRYRDTPSFMELTSLSTQFSFEDSTSVGVEIPEARLDTLDINASFKASERPTVTYDPLHGREFVERLISPLNEETIILLIRSGWSIERVLRMTVQELNGLENARRASGPTPETIAENDYSKFQDVVDSLRDLQVHNKIRIGYEESKKQLSGSIPSEQVNADAFVAAAREGWSLEPKQERVRIDVHKIAASSDVTADYLDKNLFANLVETVKAEKSQTPIRVMWRKNWRKRFPEQDPGTRLFEKTRQLYHSSSIRPLSPPTNREIRESEQAQNKLVELPFVAIEGEYGDLLLAAYRVAGIDRVPCIVEFSDYFVLTGTTQNLVMSWDKDESNSALQDSDLNELPGIDLDEGKYTLKVEPRSLIGILYYLSHAIRVPQEHESCGLVGITVNDFGEGFDWATLTGDLLLVNWSDKKPSCAAVAVQYRDVWFYIDDRDRQSKATFTLLTSLFELQAGGGAKGTRPVLTLPVGI